MKFLRPVLIAATLLGLAGSASAANILVNGEFVSGLAAWQPAGLVFDTGESAVLSDSGSLRTVIHQTAAVPDSAVLLTLSFDLLTSLSPTAGVGQTPDSLFISAFLGSTAFGPVLESGTFDTAVSILDVDFRGPANAAAGLVSAPSAKGQGWTHYTLPLSIRPFATVAFEFIDGNGISGDSTIAVDNVVLDAVLVPEPSASVCATAAASFLARRRRRTISLPRD